MFGAEGFDKEEWMKDMAGRSDEMRKEAAKETIPDGVVEHFKEQIGRAEGVEVNEATIRAFQLALEASRVDNWDGIDTMFAITVCNRVLSEFKHKEETEALFDRMKVVDKEEQSWMKKNSPANIQLDLFPYTFSS